MKLTKILAATFFTGSLALGTVGIASAAATTDTATRPSQEQLCARAHNAWQRLKNLDERARTHQEKLTALRERAAAEGNTELVAKIDARLALLKERHDLIVARLKEIHDKGQGRCAVTEPAPADPNAVDPTTTAS